MSLLHPHLDLNRTRRRNAELVRPLHHLLAQ